MNDPQAKLKDLQTQLETARVQLEVAQSKAAGASDLHEKLEHITRSRALQDVISGIESEISATRAAISAAERQKEREGLLEQARAIAHEIREQREAMNSLLEAVSEAVAALQRQGPGIIQRWRSLRERWMGLFATLEPGGWPGLSGDIENTKRLTALEAVLNELGPEARELMALPPGFLPSNTHERVVFDGRNWQYVPPQTGEDFALLALDALLNRPFAVQPEALLPPDMEPAL